MNFPTFLLVTTTALTLVLRTGERITIDGQPLRQEGFVVFRSAGALYSLPAVEIDDLATTEANGGSDSTGAGRKPLKGTAEERQKLLKALETNHSGQLPAPLKAAELHGTPEAREVEPSAQGEWDWRRQARAYQESVRQSEENLSLLLARIQSLRNEIRNLLFLGYPSDTVGVQTFQVRDLEDRVPYAQLEVQRAKRDWDQFRDDARRQGVMPGWLR